MITTLAEKACEQKEVNVMLVVEVMLALMLFTWGAAVWASFRDEDTEEHGTPQGQYWRKAA